MSERIIVALAGALLGIMGVILAFCLVLLVAGAIQYLPWSLVFIVAGVFGAVAYTWWEYRRG